MSTAVSADTLESVKREPSLFKPETTFIFVPLAIFQAQQVKEALFVSSRVPASSLSVDSQK